MDALRKAYGYEFDEPIDLRHGLKLAFPLEKRLSQLRESIRTVVECCRAWVKSDLYKGNLLKKTPEELDEYKEYLANRIRQTIVNELISKAYKSPVLEDLIQRFDFGYVHNIVSGIVSHVVSISDEEYFYDN